MKRESIELTRNGIMRSLHQSGDLNDADYIYYTTLNEIDKEKISVSMFIKIIGILDEKIVEIEQLKQLNKELK